MQTLSLPVVQKLQLPSPELVVSTLCTLYLHETMTRKPHQDLWTKVATDLYWAKVPVLWFWKSTNTPWHAERKSTVKSAVAVCLLMHITSQLHTRKD